MPYCDKCGQAEYHPPGTCPYDDDLPVLSPEELLFADETAHDILCGYASDEGNANDNEIRMRC